jgi:hypothetical protein
LNVDWNLSNINNGRKPDDRARRVGSRPEEVLVKYSPRVPTLVAVVLVVLGVALGVGGVVAGEADDSPGLQLIGVLLVGVTLALAVRAGRRTS